MKKLTNNIFILGCIFFSACTSQTGSKSTVNVNDTPKIIIEDCHLLVNQVLDAYRQKSSWAILNEKSDKVLNEKINKALECSQNYPEEFRCIRIFLQAASSYQAGSSTKKEFNMQLDKSFSCSMRQ